MIDKTKNAIKPFWSWNDALKKENLQQQIISMKKNGIEGFFMHARGGLKTAYMSDEWFDMIEVCLDKADELGMQAWAYDENGWPSGSADGRVPELGLEHQQKWLTYLFVEEETLALAEAIDKERIIAVYQKKEDKWLLTEKITIGSYIIYYEVNKYYVDVFHKETIAHFLEEVHDKYYARFKDRFGTSLKGFFTDEPQFHRAPWSFVFPEKFEQTYGYELIPVLPMLFFECIGYEAVRNDYQDMTARLFQESFIRQMYDWCTEHNCKLTGHMMNENNLHSQMSSTNGVMPCYEYFHELGMDHLGRKIASPLQPKQVGSVARQLDRKTMTETFALCGWDVSLNELKWIAQWQYVNGVTSLCPHLEGYSMRGLRKRDYPPSLFTQLPWFEEVYDDFAAYFTMLGSLLDSGKDIAPLLVIHPIHSAYILHDFRGSEKLFEYSEQFEAFAQRLNQEHILHHYGDETIMEHYGRVKESPKGVYLQIGKCIYHAVLLPELINLTSNTVDILLDFIERSGKVYTVGRLPEFENGRRTERIRKLCSAVIQCGSLDELKQKYPDCVPIECETKSPEVHWTLKVLPDDRKLLYVVNNEKEHRTVRLRFEGAYEVYERDVLKETEELLYAVQKKGQTSVTLELAECASAVLILKKAETRTSETDVKTKEYVTVNRMFHIDSRDDNAFTLDKCRYRMDGGKWQPEIAVINLQNKLFKLWKPCHVDMEFTFEIAEAFDFASVKLCMEDPEKFELMINDMPYQFADEGQFVDHSIRKGNIGSYLKEGINRIRLSCMFTQSDEIYYAKLTPGIHESVLNKLTCDTELESIYLTGDFGVRMEEPYTLGERRCIHGGKTFRLVRPAEEVDITEITHQDFWFFTGKMTLTQTTDIYVQAGKKYRIAMKYLNAPAAQVYVNGRYAGNMMFAPFELDVTELVKNGKNQITIVMLSGNRNLFGPHHKPEGESYSVGPDSFTDQRGWTDRKDLPSWTDDYNFVLFGCEIGEK